MKRLIDRPVPPFSLPIARVRRAWSRVWLAVPVLGFASLGLARMSTGQTLEAGAVRRTLLAPDLVAVGLAELGIAEGTYVRFHVGRAVFVVILLFALALVVASRARDRRPAGLFAFTFSGFGYLLFMDVLGPTAGPGPAELLVGSLLYALFFISFYVFPDGRFVPRWTRWLIVLWLVGPAGTFFPGSILDSETWSPVAAAVIWGSLFLTPPLALVIRYRRHADVEQRQQIKWVAYGLGVMTTTWVVFFMGPLLVPSVLAQPREVALFDLVGGSVLVLSYAAVPISVAMALLRRGLWDIDPIMGRTVVYGGLTGVVIGVYVGVVGYLSVVLQVGESLTVSLVATGVVAVVFQPMRQFLQNSVNRLLYGQRYEPYEAIARLGRSLELTVSPDSVLSGVVETLRDSLKLPYASVWVEDHGTTIRIVESGVANGEAVAVPLTFGTEPVGTLRLAPRAAGGRFSRAEMKLLDDLGRQVGPVAHAVRLATQLQRAREGLIQAREEERRWLSQELHDGLGPLLAAQTLTIAAARRSIHPDPQRATDLLGEAVEHARTAVEDVRRIVRGLRPPTLDSLGLRGALENLAGDFTSAGLELLVAMPDTIPDLSAATEVACYRIAQEALTNTVRHSGASVCEVELSVDGVVRLTVTDNGRGMASDSLPGVGLLSMRARAEELGGAFEIVSPPGHGTRVTVSLPIGATP